MELTYRAVWTNKATHVLYDAQDPHTCLLTEGDLSPHIPCGYCLKQTQHQKTITILGAL